MTFDDRDTAIEQLKSLGNTMILLTALSSGGSELMSFRDTAANILRANGSFSEVPLLIEGRYSLEDAGGDRELDYEKYALAITFDARLRNSIQGIRVGNMPELLEGLSGYDYLNRIGDASSASGLAHVLIARVLESESSMIEDGEYPVGYVWVRIPTDPVQKQNLINILADKAVYYAFPNGKGTIDRENLKQGGGLLNLYS